MGYIEDLNCPVETPIPLSQYARYMNISELDFWGVYRGLEMDPPSRYWLGVERRMLSEQLNAASSLMESFMRVRLRPTWTYQEETPWQCSPHELDWKRFIVGGQRATSTYEAAADIAYVGDFGAVTVAHGGVGQVGEVRAYYDDTTLAIEPYSIEFGATNIVLTFPRQRLVDPDIMHEQTNVDRGIAWEDDTNFLETLTVGREYNDPSVNAEFISQGCNCDVSCARCCQTACMVASNPRLGTIYLYPASYDDGWTRATSSLRYTPDTVRASYLSGLTALPYELADSLIRLTHSLMPDNPCPIGRDPQHRYWKRDREVREISIREVLNNPWGNTVGAWFAWNVVANHAENYGKGGGFL